MAIKKLTASKLRENIYRILDDVAEGGDPVEIERKGVTLRIVSVEDNSKLSKRRPRKWLNCSPEELLSIDWSKEWSEIK